MRRGRWLVAPLLLAWAGTAVPPPSVHRAVAEAEEALEGMPLAGFLSQLCTLSVSGASPAQFLGPEVRALTAAPPRFQSDLHVRPAHTPTQPPTTHPPAPTCTTLTRTPHAHALVHTPTPAQDAALPCRPALDFGARSFNGGALPLVPGEPLNGCGALDASRVEGRVVVLRRGVCPFVNKGAAAQQSGAAGVIVIDNPPGTPPGAAPAEPLLMSHGGNTELAAHVTIPCVGLSWAEGERLLGLLRDERYRRLALAASFDEDSIGDAEERRLRSAIAAHLRNGDLQYRLSALCRQRGRQSCQEEALAACLRLEPEHAPALMVVGEALAGQGALSEAIAHYRRAYAADPGRMGLEPLYRIAWLLLSQDRKAEAAAAYNELWEQLKPEVGVATGSDRVVLANMARLELQVASWRRIDEHWRQLEASVAAFFAGDPDPELQRDSLGLDPVHALGHPFEAGLVYRVAEYAAVQDKWGLTPADFRTARDTHATAKVPARRPALARAGMKRRLHVAYISCDLNEGHPVANKLAPLIGLHNASRVISSTFAVRSQEMDVESPRSMRAWKKRQNDHQFHEIIVPARVDAVGQEGSPERSERLREVHERASRVVDLMAGQRVDVLINVDGHAGSRGKGVAVRNQVLALAQASGKIPVAATAFGFHSHTRVGEHVLTDPTSGGLGALGTPERDAALIRQLVLPGGAGSGLGLFVGHERPLRKAAPAARWSSEVLDLVPWDVTAPPGASTHVPVIYCNFGDAYKVTPEVFATWTNILRRVPGSLLWMMRHASEEDSVEIFGNLRAQLSAAGLDPHRLVTTARLPEKLHLLAKSHAHFYLDTVPYNSHTTGFEALAAGLPVITLGSARVVASRVGASLNTVAGDGMAVGTAYTHREYEDVAVRLGTNPRLRAALRGRLFANAPLFAAEAWMGCWDRGLHALYEQRAALAQRERGVSDRLVPMHVVVGGAEWELK